MDNLRVLIVFLMIGLVAVWAIGNEVHEESKSCLER